MGSDRSSRYFFVFFLKVSVWVEWRAPQAQGWGSSRQFGVHANRLIIDGSMRLYFFGGFPLAAPHVVCDISGLARGQQSDSLLVPSFVLHF